MAKGKKVSASESDDGSTDGNSLIDDGGTINFPPLKDVQHDILRELLTRIDKDGDGHLTEAELAEGLTKYVKAEQDAKMLKKIMIAMAIMMAFMAFVLFGLMCLGIYITRDSRIGSGEDEAHPTINTMTVAGADAKFPLASAVYTACSSPPARISTGEMSARASTRAGHRSLLSHGDMSIGDVDSIDICETWDTSAGQKFYVVHTVAKNEDLSLLQNSVNLLETIRVTISWNGTSTSTGTRTRATHRKPFVGLHTRDDHGSSGSGSRTAVPEEEKEKEPGEDDGQTRAAGLDGVDNGIVKVYQGKLLHTEITRRVCCDDNFCYAAENAGLLKSGSQYVPEVEVSTTTCTTGADCGANQGCYVDGLCYSCPDGTTQGAAAVSCTTADTPCTTNWGTPGMCHEGAPHKIDGCTGSQVADSIMVCVESTDLF